MQVTPSWQVTPADFELAEGIVWDARRERLLWVDIHRGAVFTSTLGHESLEPVELLRLPTTVSAVVPAENDSLLLAAGRGLAVLDSDGGLVSGPPIAPRDDQRFNDGSCDPRGRFFVGTVTTVGYSRTSGWSARRHSRRRPRRGPASTTRTGWGGARPGRRCT